MGNFGLLGKKLSHSFSPQIHARLADYNYELFEKNEDELSGFLKNGGFDGINVTIPYKKTVMPFCASLSDEARKIGSVNTIIRKKDGTLHGENTDYFGFLQMLKKAEVSVSGKKAVVLGSGGASLSVKAVLLDCGAGEVVTVSRGGRDNYENINSHSDAQIIVNTTPVGMYPEVGVAPVELSIFTECEAVLDVIYNPEKTELILQAEDLKIANAGGLYMLIAQAKRASELFTGSKKPDKIIDKITMEILRETKNIVLIGMPGCGKSSVGKELARLTGRRFEDTDEAVQALAGKKITRIFKEDGEDAFRELESRALCQVSAKSGLVIATGGGIVKREVNRRFLRQNSTVVYLDRALDKLSTAGRPLSVSQGIEALYEERFVLYNEWSDVKVVAKNGVFETAQAVKEALLL